MVEFRTLVLCLFLSAALVAGCGSPPPEEEPFPEDPFFAEPKLEREITLTSAGHPLEPVRLQFFDELLWISYNRSARIDVYTTEFEPIESIFLSDPPGVQPSSFTVTDSLILAADHAKGLVLIYNRAGELLNSFDRLPDEETELSPLALTFYGGVAYVADIAMRRVMAVSMADAEGITETGELILTIPKAEDPELGFPSALHVTEDGRMLIGDANESQVRVFTCDGRSVYSFDPVPDVEKLAPQAFAFDGFADPSLYDPNEFDPTGVRYMGRVHMVDGFNGRVHIFNPLGKYVSSYPRGERLQSPSGIAIDSETRRIYVADGPTNRILVYRYEDGTGG